MHRYRSQIFFHVTGKEKSVKKDNDSLKMQRGYLIMPAQHDMYM